MNDDDIIDEFIDAGLLIRTATGDYEITEFGQKWAYFLKWADADSLH